MKKLIIGTIWVCYAPQASGVEHAMADGQLRPALLDLGASGVPARDIAAIDRELRGNAAPVPELADTAQYRLQVNMSRAFIGKSEDSTAYYTSPDGVYVTRIVRSGRMACYVSGTVNFVPGVLHQPDRPKAITCPPPDAGWRR